MASVRLSLTAETPRLYLTGRRANVKSRVLGFFSKKNLSKMTKLFMSLFCGARCNKCMTAIHDIMVKVTVIF